MTKRPLRCTGRPDCPCVICEMRRNDRAPENPPPPPPRED